MAGRPITSSRVGMASAVPGAIDRRHPAKIILQPLPNVTDVLAGSSGEIDAPDRERPMIELRFQETGEAYERAKVVADRLGISVRDYLLLCIAEGHVVLAARAAHETDLDRPAFERRPKSRFSRVDVEAELRKLRQTPFKED